MGVALVLVSLGALFLWGALAPRHQWHCLISWTRDNPRGSEPGQTAYFFVRLVSLAGILTMLVAALAPVVGSIRFREPPATPARNSLEVVWGQPRPVLVDRVFTAAQIPTPGLVQRAITGFQIVDSARRFPSYLFAAPALRSAGVVALPGFLGVAPRPDSTALATASLVVQVRGDSRCIPRQVIVRTLADVVSIGVFFGRPNTGDGAPAAQPGDCELHPPLARTRAFLIPVDLPGGLNGRAVKSLDEKAIPAVALPAR
ncbi:MAG: hypothetical protein H7248_00150 [Microbacteriaceae bacterium]|nr:hypothetical protein [Microbacteriaceae bacterium]